MTRWYELPSGTPWAANRPPYSDAKEIPAPPAEMEATMVPADLTGPAEHGNFSESAETEEE